jgi:hypothetical protein
MPVDILIFTKNGIDITEGIELRNGKSNPFGWSQHEIWIREQGGEVWIEYKIGMLDSGAVSNMIEGFGYRVRPATPEDHEALGLPPAEVR